MTTISLATISDRELLGAVVQAASNERRATVELIALLGEVDGRRLYLAEGCPSLFAYCTSNLGLSEHEAYHRIEAARVARRFPVVLDQLADGSVTLTTVGLLRQHLTADNVDALLAAAAHKSKREVEHQVACLAPKPDAATLVRRLPTTRATEAQAELKGSPLLADATELTAASSDIPRPVIDAGPRPKSTPLSADRYLLRVTLSSSTQTKLRRALDLLRHSIPNGDAAAVLDRALTLLIADLERRKAARTGKPRKADPAKSNNGRQPASRYIAAEVRREVWLRDEGRCAFVGRHGRCNAVSQLEFHHVEPFALGGPSTASNLALRCRAHNQFESELLFGPRTG